MHRRVAALAALAFAGTQAAQTDPGPLVKTHCAACHSDASAAGGFAVSALGERPTAETLALWNKSLTFVETAYMPPRAASQLSADERRTLVRLLRAEIRAHDGSHNAERSLPRRLNNREIANSLRDILGIEDVGTHQPLANLLGDTLKEGFDTDSESLALSQFHLEQYIEAFRKVIDATVLVGAQPARKRITVTSDDMWMGNLSQRRGQGRHARTAKSVDFLDPRLRVHFKNFATAPATGRYRITIRATGVDRGVYDSSETGIYEGDPIPLRVHLGDRERTFDLPDGEMAELELDEWIAAGTRLELSFPTDGLRVRGNSNFKFQFSIGHDYIRQTDPALYAAVLRDRLPNAPARTAKNPRHWSHWTEHWQGPRPRLFSAEIEGPLFDSWPPRRQVALLGVDPDPARASALLRPIAERAWRRSVSEPELEPIARLVRARAGQDGASLQARIRAFKEGIVAILASPSFLLVNGGESAAEDCFAAKLALFFGSTVPDHATRRAVAEGGLGSFQAVLRDTKTRLDNGDAEEFLRRFPYSWLELDQINFMAPDPDRFPLYSRKNLNEDMVNEALAFFRHAVDENVPVPELLTANYSFINADLAQVYAVDDVPQDSRLRKYTFADGRRGGFLGMAAFLSSTADSLSTSPIHRAVYVMEKFLGIHPAPPPADVEITEPDVRQAKTIKQILAAHASDPTCASCHRTIDPFGYAFENFGPVGSWRDAYTAQIAPRPAAARIREIRAEDKRRAADGLPPLPKPWNNEPIPVDSASQFPDGTPYADIVGYRRHLASDENQARFVRCFITKLLTYANGSVPTDDEEVDRILAISAEHEYRIVETIAAVVHSPLFRQN